jgi:tripartite-type tricarboxylate transporter receptor subunit TctC
MQRRCRRTVTIPFSLVLALVLAHEPARADDYPARPVTFVVPFAPGGATSLFARLLSQQLEQRLGKPFVVENRPGGGGVTAAAAVARSTPDGYTIMMASSTVLAINPTLRKSLPYDPRRDLAPVALLARVPFVLVVNPDLPVRSVADLVKLARERPGRITFGTPGPGTFHHLSAEIFKSHFGVELVHVPYKGSAPALNDIVGGHLDIMFSDISPALPLIAAGKLRPLAVTTAQRVSVLPDVAPLAEEGIPGYDASSWHTVTTTAGVPQAIIDKLHGAIRESMSDPGLVQTLTRDGTLPQVSPSPAALKEFVDTEIVRWGKVIEQAGMAGLE